MFKRTQTRAIKVGKLTIGGGSPISVQTMANTHPHDAGALVQQILSCASAGCDLFRVTVPDVEASKTLALARAQSPIPLVADIHFDYTLALAAIEAGADALRLNPGNIGGREKVQAVARAAKAKGVPIRIGVNAGSLEKGETLVSSALKHIKLLEDEKFFDIAVSVKASDAMKTVAAYRELAEKTDCPLHLGVTEAGTLIPGTVRSSVALGILLSDGIGDTIRVSLTDRPEREVKVGLEILRSLALRPPGPAITSCPTCGRTKTNICQIAEEVENALEALHCKEPGRSLPKVAVMGCAVNGLGEAKGADIALCGGDGEFILFVKGEQVCKVAEHEAAGKVIDYVIHL